MAILQHVIEAQQFDRQLLEQVFATADDMKAVVRTGKCTVLQGKIMACLFYEPSTRTRFSFESAMHHLGGDVVTTDNAGEFSSAVKGETIEDTVRIVSGYVDAIVLRHPEEGTAKLAAAYSQVPIINAGDGRGQHPTQALLDIYTIRNCLRRVDGTHLAIVGDLKNGRTARSLVYLLGKYEKTTVTFVAPEVLQMNQDIINYCQRHNIKYAITDKLAPILPHVDCVYMTRIQKERMPPEEYAQVRGTFILTPQLVQTMKQDAIIMHPLPRVDEIPAELDADSRAKYFEQARNGLFIRMALLRMILEQRSIDGR
jgi:aspartate carbamoyltransferase catalytic subunit